jgi:hypothetical protein
MIARHDRRGIAEHAEEIASGKVIVEPPRRPGQE